MRWGMDTKLVNLLRDLHVASWFTFGSADTAISTLIGGKQGCKFGAAIFNSTFALAMEIILETMAEAGITLKLVQGPPPFWSEVPPSTGPDGAPCVDTGDAAYVDDEAFLLTAGSPAKLDLAIDVLLNIVEHVYGVLSFAMNFKAKKTECFLKYRGHGS